MSLIGFLPVREKKRSRRYPAKTITDADYADDIVILANTPDQAETLLHSLERAAAGIGLYVNAHKTEYMCYNQTGDISTLEGTPLKLIDKFTYLGSSVKSTEKDIETRLTKAWTAINRLSIIWKSDLTDKMKRSFFQAAVTSILLYGYTTWTLTKRLEKKLDGNYTRMLRAILNKSWRQHPTRHQLYGHLPPITKTIQVRRTRHAGHSWRSRVELISNVLLWTPSYGRAKAGRPAQTYIQQLCEDTECCPENLSRAMNDREEWLERVRDIRATSATWWWWWWELYIKLFVRNWRCGGFAQSLSQGCTEIRKKDIVMTAGRWSSWSILIPQFLMLWWPAMKAGSTVMTQRLRGRVPSGSMLVRPDLGKPDRANSPTNFWWSLFLTALAWSTCTWLPLDG